MMPRALLLILLGCLCFSQAGCVFLVLNLALATWAGVEIYEEITDEEVEWWPINLKSEMQGAGGPDRLPIRLQEQPELPADEPAPLGDA